MRFVSYVSAVLAVLVVDSTGLGQSNILPIAATNLPAPSPPTTITVQLAQPSTKPENPTLYKLTVYAPYAAAVVALLGIIGTALYTLHRGRMDARYEYASEILKLRLRQIQEFYAPALLLIEQSRIVYEKLLWTIEKEMLNFPLIGFRLLDHIYKFKTDPMLGPLVKRVLEIGSSLTKLITEKSGLMEGGLTPTFIEYQAHFEILNAASEQDLTEGQKQGWHEFGYYPRMLNREIREGFKVVLAHLENYANTGDQIISRLMRQKPVEVGKYRRQLLENLQFYEDNAKEYVCKFDSFDLSEIRQRFVDVIERTRSARPKSFGNGLISILDAGCGTGRDTYEFLKKGYAVVALDPSPAMLRECRRKLRSARDKPESAEMEKAALASRWLEVTFDEIPYRNKFDGVWAAASLLHVPHQQMEDIVGKLLQALKPDGILFMSFRYGRGEHERDARFYTYFSRNRIRSILKDVYGVEEIEMWLSDSQGKHLSKLKQWKAWRLEFINSYNRNYWLNVLVKRRPN